MFVCLCVPTTLICLTAPNLVCLFVCLSVCTNHPYLFDGAEPGLFVCLSVCTNHPYLFDGAEPGLFVCLSVCTNHPYLFDGAEPGLFVCLSVCACSFCISVTITDYLLSKRQYKHTPITCQCVMPCDPLSRSCHPAHVAVPLVLLYRSSLQSTFSFRSPLHYRHAPHYELWKTCGVGQASLQASGERISCPYLLSGKLQERGSRVLIFSQVSFRRDNGHGQMDIVTMVMVTSFVFVLFPPPPPPLD